MVPIMLSKLHITVDNTAHLVFPLPLGPRMIRNSPRFIGNEDTEEFSEMLRRTGISLPSWSLYDFFRSVMITISSSDVADSVTEPFGSLFDCEFYVIHPREDSPFWGEDSFQRIQSHSTSPTESIMNWTPFSLLRNESARWTRTFANRTEKESGRNYRRSNCQGWRYSMFVSLWLT